MLLLSIIEQHIPFMAKIPSLKELASNTLMSNLVETVSIYDELQICLNALEKEPPARKKLFDTFTLSEKLFVMACQNSCFTLMNNLIRGHAREICSVTAVNEGFYVACYFGQLDMVKFLMESKLHTYSHHGYALWLACDAGHLSVVQYLVNHGINDQEMINTGLSWACKSGHLIVVEFLVKYGADIQYDNHYPFRCAYRHNQTNVINYFLELANHRAEK